MSIYCNHKQAVHDCFKASFCLSIMCLILHSTSAEHTSSIVLSKDVKLSNKLAASFPACDRVVCQVRLCLAVESHVPLHVHAGHVT